MKQGIKTTIIALLLVVAAAAPGYAQKVYKQADAVVLDFGPGSGFPQGAVETVKGKKIAAGTPSNIAGPMVDNDVTGAINATVYQKLEIAAETESSLMSWYAAYVACQNRGAGWRLPTQRELIAIWTFRSAIESLLGSSGAFPERDGTPYWSATESSSDNSCALYLPENRMHVDNKRYGC